MLLPSYPILQRRNLAPVNSEAFPIKEFRPHISHEQNSLRGDFLLYKMWIFQPICSHIKLKFGYIHRFNILHWNCI